MNFRPPAKQLAVDDEVAPNIIQNGYIVDDSGASNDGSVKLGDQEERVIHLEDMEMDDGLQEEDSFDYEGSKLSLKGDSMNGEGVHDEAHADKRNGLASKLKRNVQLGSVVLSEEVRASLAKKPSDVYPLIPRSIVDQMYKNAMAVVLWQPPPTTLISERVKASSAAISPSTVGKENNVGQEDEDLDLVDPTCDNIIVVPGNDGAGDMEVEVIPNFT